MIEMEVYNIMFFFYKRAVFAFLGKIKGEVGDHGRKRDTTATRTNNWNSIQDATVKWNLQ